MPTGVTLEITNHCMTFPSQGFANTSFVEVYIILVRSGYSSPLRSACAGASFLLYLTQRRKEKHDLGLHNSP